MSRKQQVKLLRVPALTTAHVAVVAIKTDRFDRRELSDIQTALTERVCNLALDKTTHSSVAEKRRLERLLRKVERWLV